MASPDDWKLELYMNPSSTRVAILLVLVSSLAVLSVLIWGLDWMEKREDDLERRRVLHVINFDAL